MRPDFPEENPMKKDFMRSFLICLSFMLAFGSAAMAQDETITAAGSKYLISARAGGVNFVEGTVAVVRKAGTSGRLIKGETLEIGDRVSTGADGKAEILLNPGSFLRLGGNSSFEFKTTSLENLQIRLDSGSAILEVFATEDFRVAVNTPKTKYILTETGVYRIDVIGTDGARLEVWKGAAEVGTSGELVKAGRVATWTPNGYAITKFDRDEKDSLDTWSKLRGKELAKVTERLKDRNVRTALMRSFLGRGWSLFGSFGLWVFDPFYGGYVFLPFGRGWNSPYGYSYACHLGWYNLPPVVWYPPAPSTGGGPTPPTVTPIVSAGTRDPIPPFVRLQETMGGGRGGSPIYDAGGSSYNPSQGSSSSPSYSPPPSPPPSSLGTGKVDSPPTKQP